MNKSRFDVFCNDVRAALDILRGKGEVSSKHKPMVTIELTSICTLKCPLCPTGTGKLQRENKFIPLEYVKKIVELTRPIAQGYVLSMWGEPILYPWLDEAMKLSAPSPTWISTNLNCKESVVQALARHEHAHVMAAIDTVDPSEYTEYRVGGNYERVLENLKILALGKCQTYVQFLVDPDDYDQERFLVFVKKYGVEDHNIIIKSKRSNFTLMEKENVIRGNCHSPFSGLFFDCDGNQLPCCNDVKSDLHINNIRNIKLLEDMIASDSIKRVRKNLARNKNRYKSCGQCRGENFWKLRLSVYADYIKGMLPGQKSKEERPQRMPFEE